MRSPSGRYIRWSAILAKLAKVPGVWVLALSDVPASTRTIVTKRRHIALRQVKGTLEVTLRNAYVTDSGQRRGDLYLKLTPPSDTGSMGTQEGT